MLNVKERAMAVLYHEEPDMLPWLIPEPMLKRGSLERELRNRGMGLVSMVNAYRTEQPHVKVKKRMKGGSLYTFYHTPLGDVSTRQRTDLKKGAGESWTVEYIIKNLEDYEAAKFMIEDTEYSPAYEGFLEAERDLGEDGIAMTGIRFSNPLLRALKMYLGHRRWAIDMHRHPKEFMELIDAIDKKQEDLYRVVAESPAEVVWGGDAGIDDAIISPKLYEKYCLPTYERYGKILHKKGKIYAVHMDGKLGGLKDLIKESNIDVVHGFTPPPMGNLPLEEAEATWGDRFVIWMNFPETVFVYGVEETKRYATHLIYEAAPHSNLIMGITEDIPPKILRESLTAITEIMAKHGKYPCSQ